MGHYSPPVTKKTCLDCRKTFPCCKDTRVSMFYPRKSRATGHITWKYLPRCRNCENKRLYLKRRMITRYAVPEKLPPEERRRRQLARQALANAVWDGRIAKPDKCSRCLKKVKKVDLHGHHHDYDKRYEVTWLCRWCHMKEEGVHDTLLMNERMVGVSKGD